MKKVLIISAIVLLVIIGAAAGGLYYVNSKIFVPTSPGAENQKTTVKTVSSFQSLVDSVSNESGVDNIVLAGIDARNKDTASRTDSIMMATIDRTNKELKLTSFMRDMYVDIPGYSKKYKINTAYFFGGPELLIDTLNQNFNTNAQYYVTIDFKAFQALVDKFNGIDINVKPYEIKEMNKYIKEENWHNPIFVTKPGLQHLNGQQVLSYCRIRKVGNNDYERTERQRRVLSLLIQKGRKESLFDLPGLLTTLLPYIKTNIPSSKLLAFGISAYKCSGSQTSTIRIPADGMYTSQVIGGQDVLVPDIQKNTELLSQFIASKEIDQSKLASKTGTNTNNNNNSNNSNSNNGSIPDNSQTTSSNIDTAVPAPNTNNDSNFTSQNAGMGDNEVVSKGDIGVAVLNSTGKAGLAAEYKLKLEKLGYKVVETGNYTYRKYQSTVINDYSNQGYGDILLQDLKLGNIKKKHKEKPVANVVIILGNDSINLQN